MVIIWNYKPELRATALTRGRTNTRGFHRLQFAGTKLARNQGAMAISFPFGSTRRVGRLKGGAGFVIPLGCSLGGTSVQEVGLDSNVRGALVNHWLREQRVADMRSSGTVLHCEPQGG
jgi:hypothetical protein